jgi:hypothetical protein
MGKYDFGVKKITDIRVSAGSGDFYWRDARVVERGGLENRYTSNGIGGSNPPLSAKQKKRVLPKGHFFISGREASLLAEAGGDKK